MHIYQQIFEFAASAGAFEGYVYHKKRDDMDVDALTNWVGNLVGAYEQLTSDVRNESQTSCDQTLGRAIRSVASLLGEDHNIVIQLKSMVKGELPQSADDFQKRKWFATK
jgi:hypothetical protein